jgi:membrane-bound lytic murein transglycosylase B
MISKINKYFVFFVFLSLHSYSYSDYSEHPKAEYVIKTLISEHDFDGPEVKLILSLAKTDNQILKSMTNAAEKTKTWTKYRQGFVSSLRIEQGKNFLKKYSKVFDEVEKKYGVSRFIITAILGVETNYGGYTGKVNVLNALSTLAFEHPRRSSFFTNELIEYIVLCREQSWEVNERFGSYAGAMGMSQFMPSNYRRLAVDGDSNGEIDLFHPVDAIHSIANYLVHHGWKPNNPITSRVIVGKNYDESIITRGLKPNRKILELKSAGFYPQEKISEDILATVIRFNDSDGDEFWLGYENFYVISRYNPRAKYAMAVYLLSKEIEN